MNIILKLCEEFNKKQEHIQNVVNLIDEGNTIPFIARYRKEMHGSLDDQILREISDRLNYLRGLEKRKEEVISSIENQEKMTDDILHALENAKTLAEVEDIYRPFKQKRKTRASVAREKGLEPLATYILEQNSNQDIQEIAEKYINPEKDLISIDDILQGAKDIIAEDISDNAEVRKLLRDLFMSESIIQSKAIDPDLDSVYSMYYDFSESIKSIAGHRVLAIDRGEKENFLKVNIIINQEKSLNIIYNKYINQNSALSHLVQEACEDSYNRLISPSLEREVRAYLTENAAENAIKVFSVNLRQLLLQPPIKSAVTLGLDPGFRTGCKLAVVDKTGRVLDTGVIYNTPPHNKVEEAKKIVTNFIKKYNVDVVSIGNGTASRESEAFIAELLSEINNPNLAYVIVNEAGASVYSASKLAAEEFPEYDVSLRSAVSIARRLQDPLAELVKIDPKSIGVGQYQHDMPKKRMDEALGSVVEDCVNHVGVDLNTASVPLLSSVAGINTGVAKNIVLFREENGAFESRKTLLKIPKLGKKTYEQCAGFLRVVNGKNILDNTGIHPETYKSTEQLLKLCGYSLNNVQSENISDLVQKVDELGKENICNQLNIGIPTLNDIIKELLKPGRDPRDELPKPILRKDVLEIEDLTPDMELMGTVRNVIDFGAFVDIGVHEDGLVHISQISDKYIKHPSEVLKVGDVIKVKVLSIDIDKKRIALTMKNI